MKIDYRRDPSHKAILVIHCDGEPWRKIHTAIYGKYPSFPHEVPSLDALEQLFATLEHRLAKQYAIKRLSAQSLPSSMLKRALSQRLISELTIGSLLKEFQELGYLNDSEWASRYSEQLQRKKFGPKAIAYKLASKGIGGQEAHKALEISDENAQKEAIRHLLRKKYKGDYTDPRLKRRAVAFLVRRGFDLSNILEIMIEKPRA